MSIERVETIIIGAGIAGTAAAYFLSRQGDGKICLVDRGQPMSFTSAQSGDNYRNWWPHPVMTAFTDYSIDLLQEFRDKTRNRIHMNDGGYLLATRESNVNELTDQLCRGYASSAAHGVRVHETNGDTYRASLNGPATGVDIINRDIIKTVWPHLDKRLSHIVHIRRAGDFDSQQLAQYMLESMDRTRFNFTRGLVTDIDSGNGFSVFLDDGRELRSNKLVVAVGPFVNQVLSYLDEQLPVENILQQKLAFEDNLGAVPRDQPFTVEMDAMPLDWTADEHAMLESDDEFGWLAETMPGGTHCRPEGGTRGKWVKLGWAYNEKHSEPDWYPPLDDQFPEVVLRGAARLIPALKKYYDHLPSRRSHYGGYYTMTKENWPVIGPLETPGVFVIGALSGFGSMAACAAGALCTQWMTGANLPDFALPLSSARFENEVLMTELRQLGEKGSL